MTASGAKSLSAFVATGEITSAVFREMMDALPVAIYTTDAEGRLTYFNPAAVRLSGRTPELGNDKWCVTWKIYLPDGTPLPHDQCPMAVALSGSDVPTGIECVAERPDGSRFWFTPCPAAIRDAQGRIIGGINVLLDITDRKTAEMETKEQLRAIIETTPECIKTVAHDGTLIFMNGPGLRLVGASLPEDVIGKNIYDLIAPEDRDRFRQFNERICEGERGSLEFDLIGLRGIRRHMETHAAPLRHADGTTVHLAVTRDITERVESQRQSVLLSAIVDSSDDAIISKDLSGVITSWNNSAQRLFGYTAEEAIGKTVAELLIPENRQDEEPEILATLRRGERVDHFETIRRKKDGSLLDISLTVSPVKDSKGRIIGASKIARDISARKRTEQALRASEERFRLAQSAAKIGVFEWNVQTGVNLWSPELEELYGLKPGSFQRTQSAWEDLVHPEDRESAAKKVEEAFSTGVPAEGEWRVIWPDGSAHWIAGRFQLERDSQGKPERLRGVNFEITERKHIEDELRRANQDLEQFAFSASHDLQEPLRSVSIYSELLARDFGDRASPDALKYIQYLRSGATRMQSLVRDLLTYTRATKLDQTVETTDANAALQAALADLSGTAGEARASIVAEPLPTSLTVPAPHLQQLFQNLVGNGIKYRSLDRTPEIHISAERQGNRWIFAVADNGIGIEPEYKETIFGLFKRLHSGDEYSGTGIGLAICQRIVDSYHGRIWVESQPGVGSIFRFTLPV